MRLYAKVHLRKEKRFTKNISFGADAVTRIRTWVVAATTRSTNHYTITAKYTELTCQYSNQCYIERFN